MAATIDGVFVNDLREKIINSKILVVGAGGIGCEILKNLVLCAFPDIEIIDLDTIDLSNLNRQFLFHREHVGKSKAQVAKDSAIQFNPNAKITAYHDSITSTDYGVNFYKKFNVVLNALDNRAARNHVNRMCLNADVPLIESGTAGYNGQVELIKKGLTQCYECTPKTRQKTFPGCTIRNTPSEPIHCIVWAKHLFNQLFGETSDEEDISPDMADPEAENGELTAKSDTETASATNGDHAIEEKVAGNIERISTRQWAKDCQFDAESLFNKFFHDDINYLLSMSNLWKIRKAPVPVRWQKLMEGPVEKVDTVKNGESIERQYHNVWTLVECAEVFKACIKKLSLQYANLPNNDYLTWDKDDQDGMDFVAACANIRAYIFEIPRKSRFEIKSMAGNIIPAIATTNAITAGTVVLQTFKVLREQYENCTSVYMRLRINARQQLLVPEKKLTPPNPKCIVCSAEPAIYLRVDTNRLKIVELRDEILKQTLNMVQPEVTIDSKGIVIISADIEETEDNEQKVLSEMHIVDGVILRSDDFVQQYELRIIIVHFDAGHDDALFEVIADEAKLKPKEEPKAELDEDESGPSISKRARLENNVVNADDDDDDDCVIEEEDEEDEEVDAAKAEESDEENIVEQEKKVEQTDQDNKVDNKEVQSKVDENKEKSIEEHKDEESKLDKKEEESKLDQKVEESKMEHKEEESKVLRKEENSKVELKEEQSKVTHKEEEFKVERKEENSKVENIDEESDFKEELPKPETMEISDEEEEYHASPVQEVVDLFSESSSDGYSEQELLVSKVAPKRKAPIVEEEITVLDSDEEEEEAKIAAAAQTHNIDDDDEDDDDENEGPTPCKRSRIANNSFISNEIINID